MGYTFHFDAEYVNQPRLILDVDGNQQQPFNYTGILSSGSPSCRKFKLTVAVCNNGLEFARFKCFIPMNLDMPKETPYYDQDFSRPAIFRLTAKLLKNVRPMNNSCLAMTDQSLTKDPAGSMHILIAGASGRRKNGTPQDSVKIELIRIDFFLCWFFKTEKDTFCATCPVVDQTQKAYVENSAAFTSECGPDNICQEDLEVNANFISGFKSV